MEYYILSSDFQQGGLNQRFHKGQVHISKRGNPEVRRLLYMSVLRIVQSPLVASWYKAKKQGRCGKNGSENSLPALIAVMRKVLIGLYMAIKKNEPFDPSRLFRIRSPEPPVSPPRLSYPEVY